MTTDIIKAAEWIKKSKHTTVFTGAGISVESGIPPFRGENGLWNKYDPSCVDLSYFHANPSAAWAIIKEIFYDFFGQAEPNDAHKAVAELERMGLVKAVITQNIDNLHQEAGSKQVYEFHGTAQSVGCTRCGINSPAGQEMFASIPPTCRRCSGILKPDFIFFGEGIPEPARTLSFREAELADVFIIIGTTGQVVPACNIPYLAKKNHCKIIEVNLDPSSYTPMITDIYLQGKATETMKQLMEELT